jgi:hypothetical protein
MAFERLLLKIPGLLYAHYYTYRVCRGKLVVLDVWFRSSERQLLIPPLWVVRRCDVPVNLVLVAHTSHFHVHGYA